MKAQTNKFLKYPHKKHLIPIVISIFVLLLLIELWIGFNLFTREFANKNIAATVIKEFTLFFSFCFFTNGILAVILVYFTITNQNANQKLYEVAYMDAVTTLGNEVYLKEKGQEFLEETTKNKYIAVFDINKFQAYNKLYDYEFCNQILKAFGQNLIEVLPDNAIVCRITRDLFGAVFSYPNDIEKLIHRVFEKISKMQINQIDLQLTISIGIYKIRKEDQDINSALDKAYMARAKIKGPYNHNYYIFDKELEAQLLEEQKIEAEMQNALQKGEFKIFYQPKVNTNNETFEGAEALVRWEKENTMILPNTFIPIFERNKFILKLDLYVFEQVCKDMAAWKEQYGFFPTISVNLSKEHFSNEYFIDAYVKLANQYGIDRSKIDLEITESATIDKKINIVNILKYIKKKGFLISIDDFGTGYSALGMLQDMPMDIIKIDKSFIDRANLESKENIINYIVFIAKNLKTKTIVEGVETKEQVLFIRKLKCDMIQGYYYSKPLKKVDFEHYLKEHSQITK